MTPGIRYAVAASALAIAGLLGQAPAIAKCADEIDAAAKTMASQDAGSGPTATGSTSSAAGTMGSTDTPKAGTVPETEATPAMNQVASGKATSASDVQQQTQGQPTAGDAAQTGIEPTDGPMQAQATLAEARKLMTQGKEQECMAAVAKAKTQM